MTLDYQPTTGSICSLSHRERVGDCGTNTVTSVTSPFLNSAEGRPPGARLLNNARTSYSRPLARKRPPRIGRYETRRDVFNCPTWRVRRGATMDVKPMRAKNSAHFNRKGSAPLSSSLCSQSFCQTLPVHHCIPSNRPLGSLTNVPVAGGVGQRRPLHPSA